MIQVLLCFGVVVLAQATSSAESSPRLLRHELYTRQIFPHVKRHAVEVDGKGRMEPVGLTEEAVGVVNGSSKDSGEESDVALTARIGFEEPECKKILQKVRSLLHFHASQLIDQGLHKSRESTLVVVFAALNRLEAGNATVESLEVLQAAMGNLTLKTALQAGKVWTATDQGAFFYNCFPGLTPFEQLEEHNFFGDIETDLYLEPTVAIDTGDPYVELHEFRYCYRLGTNSTAKRAFVAARKHISEQVPCLRFTAVKPNVSADGCVLKPAIEVRDQNSGCWSGYQKDASGRNTGTIFLNLGRGCEMKGMIVHQLMKILGVRKELTRIDRDTYLNVRTENLREPWMARFFQKRMAPPAVEAYSQDPFDYLSINMFPATAYANSTSPSLEPARDSLLAKFLGQRMGLSQLDVEALGDLYGCPATIQPSSPTRVLAQLLLAGRGIQFDGSCRDQTDVAQNLTLLLSEPHRGCSSVEHHDCTSRLGIADLCPFTCMRCIPADDELVAMRNRLFHKEAPQYCDDSGCHTMDPEGLVCKEKNPDAQQIQCEAAAQAYCDDAGCESSDPEGRECRERNPGAHQIECAVVSSVPELQTAMLKANKHCADQNETGIKFKGGPKASCRDLQGYCSHASMGAQVRHACPATCSENGYPCGVEAIANASSVQFVDAEGCRDKGKDEQPVLKVYGLAQPCEQISRYCLEHANSSVIQKKCPFTCGACVPGTGYRPSSVDDETDLFGDILADGTSPPPSATEE
mmetsp:Transcript_8459/g.19492  ORF Transcript_8459/g.19492 Transcript_8459/m.19492 type:complete len:749 (-) Transcript_8459:76-2322(-)